MGLPKQMAYVIARLGPVQALLRGNGPLHPDGVVFLLRNNPDLGLQLFLEHCISCRLTTDSHNNSLAFLGVSLQTAVSRLHTL